MKVTPCNPRVPRARSNGIGSAGSVTAGSWSSISMIRSAPALAEDISFHRPPNPATGP